MSDLKRFQQLVDDIWEMVFGTVRRPEVKFKGMMKEASKPKRARTKKGRYKADDPTTRDFNEAYVGGKAPTRKDLLGLKKKRKTKRKK